MKRFVLLFLLATLSGAAFAQTKFKTQKGGHCYTVQVPDYMTKTYDLNEVASLQYYNSELPAYVIVIHDYKDQLEELEMTFSGPKAFLEDFLEYYQAEAEERELSPITEFTEGGLKFAQSELTWRMEDEKLAMLITTVETAGHFYKILSWTNLDMRAKLMPDFQKMIRSLRE